MKETLLTGGEPDGWCECDAHGYDRYQPCGAACGRDIDLGKEDARHFGGQHWHVECIEICPECGGRITSDGPHSSCLDEMQSRANG